MNRAVPVRADVRPFPFDSLEALTRADVATAARLRRVSRELVDTEAIARAVSELVDAPVRITVGRHRRLDAARGTGDGIGVVLAPAGERAMSKRVLVDVEGALGATLTARALRQRAPRVVDPSRPASPALSGAVAAIVMTALRRAHAEVPLEVIAAGPAADLARDLLASERDVTSVSLSVVVGEDVFHARVSVPDAAAPPERERRFSRAALVRMGDARIALSLVVTTTLASRGDLDALAPGDAFMPAKPGLDVRPGGALVCAVALVAPTSERGLAADLAEDGRLVVRGLLEIHSLDTSNEKTNPMPSDPNATATIEALEDAPVVVRVELGTVEMKAREWAELGPGDVIALGRRVGDPAILRVGGVELARGELVQVDGEYGVRIVARTGGER